MKFFQYSGHSSPAILQTTSAYLRSLSLSGSFTGPFFYFYDLIHIDSYRTKPMHETIPFHSILQRPEGSDLYSDSDLIHVLRSRS